MYGEDSEWCMRLRRMGHRILYAPAVGTVYHVGAVSSDLMWTEKERLAHCYRGGIESYAALHGRRRATLYHLVELGGATLRWAVYSAATAVRPGDYVRSQADFYRWLARFYVAGAARPVDRGIVKRHTTGRARGAGRPLGFRSAPSAVMPSCAAARA